MPSQSLRTSLFLSLFPSLFPPSPTCPIRQVREIRVSVAIETSLFSLISSFPGPEHELPATGLYTRSIDRHGSFRNRCRREETRRHRPRKEKEVRPRSRLPHWEKRDQAVSPALKTQAERKKKKKKRRRTLGSRRVLERKFVCYERRCATGF